MKAIQTAAES